MASEGAYAGWAPAEHLPRGSRRRRHAAAARVTCTRRRVPARCAAEAAEVWIVEDGEVHAWDGDFEDYKNELIREIAAELDEQVGLACWWVGGGGRQP